MLNTEIKDELISKMKYFHKRFFKIDHLIPLGLYLLLIYSSFSMMVMANTISSNPAAVNLTPGNGALQSYIESQLNIQNDYGIKFDGAWVGDVNDLFSGGIPKADRWTTNSSFLFDLSVDTNKLLSWKGGLFDAQFLQFNGQPTNEQAGTVQGYNSLPGPPPLNRSELYQLWFRQELFEKKLIVRIGKVAPTFTFNNVTKPVPLESDNIPAVTSLIYTPIFVNATMLGVLPGYYNTAYGITIDFVPNKMWYISLGTYDGNLAQGKQTGLTGPTFNGSYFHIGESGIVWEIGRNHLPGRIGFGTWHQTGLIKSEANFFEHGASGYYIFGSQRLWYKHPGIDDSGISGFFQFGANNSNVLSMLQYFGIGLTGFGLIPFRCDDSVGIGAAYSWVNQLRFSRKTELILQGYYQAAIFKGIYLEPAITYIPTPAAFPHLNAAWAETLRLIVLF